MNRPIAVDLFAGAGGMSLGFEQAGFDIVAAVEIDPVHCAVHKFNFPDCAIVPRSISEVTGAEIRVAAGIGDRPIDCVFGGPPCQGFSLIGHRSLEDPRNSLVLDFVRLVAELNARTFVFENVKGLTVGRHRGFLDELIAAFDSVGYTVRIPWKVLNASHFGVPQRRERLILLGSKSGTQLPDYAPPHAGSPPTCKDALDDLPNADGYSDLRFGDQVRSSKWKRPSRYAMTLRCASPQDWFYGHARKWDSAFLTSSWRTEHSAISQRRFLETTQGEVEPISRFFRLDGKGLSNTLRAGTDGSRGAFTSPRPIHYKYPRCVTVREMARLHGFPDWFRFHSTKWHGARQVGNAVPPPMARAVALQVIVALGAKSSRSRKTVELGDEGLLRLDLGQASCHFGVTPPAARRDRKSGARKRSQRETEAARLRALGGIRG